MAGHRSKMQDSRRVDRHRVDRVARSGACREGSGSDALWTALCDIESLLYETVAIPESLFGTQEPL